jgi:exo-beta-1,3-glucanase (GH17 family)
VITTTTSTTTTTSSSSSNSSSSSSSSNRNSSSSIGNYKLLANIEERTGMQPFTAFIGDFFIHHSWSCSLRHYDPVLYVVELEEYLEITTALIMYAVNSKTSIVQYPYNETILENVGFSRIQA